MIEIAVNNLAAATGARTVTGESIGYAAGALSTRARSRKGRFSSPFPVKTSTAMILLPVPSSRVPAPS